MIKSYHPERNLALGSGGPTRRSFEPSLDDSRFESLLLELHAAIDVPSFWVAVQSMLCQVTPYDACVAYLDFTDFAHTWSAAQILATTKARKPAQWLQGRREVDVMPSFILANPGVKLYQLSDVVPNSYKLHRSEFFRRYMAPEGWCYTSCSLFWQGDRLASEIAIRRTAEQGEFTRSEMALLRKLHPHIETALRRLAALERSATTTGVMDGIYFLPPSERVPALFGLLTPAERDLLRLVRLGMSNKEMAAHLGKSTRTVKTQFTSIYKKCGVRSRSRLLAMTL